MRDLASIPPAAALPASWLYGLGAALWRTSYDFGWRRAERLPVPVVSVGNLEVGGTGKTPAVRALAEAALAMVLRPAILTRGYGGARSRGVLLGGAWLDEAGGCAGAADEALLLSRALPTVPVIVDPRRSRGARAWLARGAGVDLFLLDDGFQHRALARDRDLVLLDARRPLANRRLLPAGPLREAPSALRRAHHLILTGADPQAPLAPDALADLDRFAPGIPRTRGWTVARGLVALAGGNANPPALRGLAVHAVAAIARPERFRALLLREGARVEAWSVFRDHHPFAPGEIAALEGAAAARGLALVTTAKDSVRLAGHADPAARWWVLEVTLEVDGGWSALLK